MNGVNCALIGRMAGVSQINDRFLRPMVEQAAEAMGLEPGGMDTPISCHPATQRPWRDRFSPLSLHHEEYMLIAACYIVCAYLSGMRVSEIMQVQRGCHFTETTADGLITRHKLRGTTFKDHGRRGIPATWVVIAPVAEAIAVLEQLTDRDELFWAQRIKPQTVPYGAVVQHTYFLKTFRDHVNRIAATGAVPIAAIALRCALNERGEPLAQSAQLSGGAPAAGVLTEELSFLSQILGREMLSEAAGTPVSLMKPDGEAQT